MHVLFLLNYDNSTPTKTMSEEVVTDALQTPLENNTEAADNVKKMLAELKGGAGSREPEKVNGNSEKINGASEEKPEEKNGEGKHDDKENDDRHPDRRHRNDDDDAPRYRQDRDDRGGGKGHRGGRGGRDRGRGDFKPRNKRENIKSNLVQEEESNDPVAIRKQVMRTTSVALHVF